MERGIEKAESNTNRLNQSNARLLRKMLLAGSLSITLSVNGCAIRVQDQPAQKCDAIHSLDSNTLEAFSNSPDMEKRKIAAFEDNTPISAKEKLARDKECEVKHGISMMTDDPNILDNLSKDPCSIVVWHVTWNSNTRTGTLISILNSDLGYISDKFYGDANIDMILSIKETVKESLIKRARNKETKAEDLILIANSNDKKLRKIAKKNLRKRHSDLNNQKINN